MWWLALAFHAVTASAGPIPGTASSTLVSQKPGLFYSRAKGFRIDAANTAWIKSAPPKKIPSLVTIYKSPVPIDGQQPALTVRVDDLRHPLGLKAYVKKWMQD